MGDIGTLCGSKNSDTLELTYSADRPLTAVIEDLEPSSDKILVNHDGTTAPQLNSSTLSSGDVVWKDSDGLLNLTLKSVRDNDYFDGTASNEVWEVLRLTNVKRETLGLAPLTLSDGLMIGAATRAEEITGLAQTGALSNHTRPDGTAYYTVLEGKYNFSGENLDGGASSPEAVMDDWIGSAAHYANIKDTRFTKLGVGYNYFDEGGNSALRYYWTQLFADSLSNPETVSTAELLRVTVEVNTVSKAVTLTEDDDTLDNADYGMTIDGGDGDDSIQNSGLVSSITGGAGNDTISNSGSFVTICAGLGDDSISLSSDAKENLIEYALGDGSDTISGFGADSTLSIAGDEYTPATVGNSVVISVGTDSITLLNAASLSAVNIIGTRSKLYIGTDEADSITNSLTSATIQALGNNDLVTNSGSAVSIRLRGLTFRVPVTLRRQ